MKLNDAQRGAIGSAVIDYIEYCVNEDTDSLDVKDSKLYSLANGQLYNVLCLFYNTGAPDPVIQEKLDNREWSSPKEVFQYIELTLSCQEEHVMFTDEFAAAITPKCVNAFNAYKAKEQSVFNLVEEIYQEILAVQPGTSCSEGWDIVLCNGKESAPTRDSVLRALNSAPVKKHTW